MAALGRNVAGALPRVYWSYSMSRLSISIKVVFADRVLACLPQISPIRSQWHLEDRPHVNQTWIFWAARRLQHCMHSQVISNEGLKDVALFSIMDHKI